MVGWSLRRQVFAGNPAPEANFVAPTAWDGPPEFLEAAKREEVYKAAIGMTFAQHQQKMLSMRSLVGQTISHVHEIAPDGQTVEGDYVVYRRYKTLPNHTRRLDALMHDTQLLWLPTLLRMEHSKPGVTVTCPWPAAAVRSGT